MNRSLLRILVTLSDGTMFPIIRPGSIVQIDQNQRKVVQTKWEDEDDRPIYFVELRGEFICSWGEMRDGYLSAVPHHCQRANPLRQHNCWTGETRNH